MEKHIAKCWVFQVILAVIAVKIAVIQPFLLCRIDRMAQSTKRNLEFKLKFALFFVTLFIIDSVVSM